MSVDVIVIESPPGTTAVSFAPTLGHVHTEGAPFDAVNLSDGFHLDGAGGAYYDPTGTDSTEQALLSLSASGALSLIGGLVGRAKAERDSRPWPEAPFVLITPARQREGKSTPVAAAVRTPPVPDIGGERTSISAPARHQVRQDPAGALALIAQPPPLARVADRAGRARLIDPPAAKASPIVRGVDKPSSRKPV